MSQVTVTGSTGANGAYTTVGAAFTAINGAGTQAGNNIIVEISANTSEAGPAVLNSSDWATLIVRPSVDGVTVSGATTTGRGLIELNGADLVTIDGDNPNTGGTNRNLTLQNTAANTITYTSVIRVCVAATQISADFNIVRNLNMIGSATGRNAVANTSTTGSENTTFGVVAGGNGGASVPTAITSVTGTAPAGTTINLLAVDNNSIVSVARGVGFFGTAAANSSGVSITNNTIGGAGTLVGDPPYTSPADTVYTKGVIVQGTTAVTIAGNTIRNILSYVGTTMAGIELTTAIGTGALNVNNNTVTGVVNNGTSSGVRGIDIVSNTSTAASVSGNTVSNIQWLASTSAYGVGVVSTGPSGSLVIQKNKVSGVNSRSTGTFGAYGLTLSSGTAVTIRNNFISDVQHNMTGGGAFSTTFGVFGLRIAGGTNHQIYNNSVNLNAAYLGTATSSLLSAAFAILGTGQTGMDVRNNIFSNTITGGTTSIAHVSVYLPSGGTSLMNLNMNNNDYVFGIDTARQGAGQAGTTAGTNFFNTFNPASTSPASNLRSYTNTLNGVGSDDLSVSADPQFNSPTDLHVSGVSPVLNLGSSIGSVTDDIDGDARPIEGVYEIGADERATVVSPGQIQLTASAYGGNEGTSVMITATRTMGTSGAVGVSFNMADVTATGGGACGGAVDYVNTGGSFNWGAGVGGSQSTLVSLCTDAGADPGETFTFTISAPTGGATLGSPAAATVTITDVPPPFNGAYTVGGGGTYPSLTNAGGIFEAINLAGASGPVTINIVSDLTGETGAVALNPIAGNPTVLIKPSGAPRTISGVAPIAVIRINGADNVTINGSTTGALIDDELVGGNPVFRELTVQNLSTSTSSGIIHIGSATESSTGNTVKNVNAIGTFVGADPATLSGITVGAATPGTVALFANNNTVIENCSVRTVLFGIANLGVAQATPNTGSVISRNDMTGTGTARIKRLGIYIINDNGGVVSENMIGGIDNTGESADAGGIGAGAQAIFESTTTTTAGVQNITISRNRIIGVSQDATFSAFGIAVAGVTGTTNTIVNNLVSGVICDGDSGDLPAGIFVLGGTGGTTRVYYNSVSMTGNRSALLTPATDMNPSFAFAINGTDPIVELKDNIFYTTQTAATGGADATSYAIGMATTTFLNLDSDYNIFFSTGAQDGGFRTGSLDRAVDVVTEVDYATVALWGAAVTDDANSILIGEVDPLFFNPATDPHITATSPARNVGIPIPGVLIDHDGNPRPNPLDAFVVQVDIGGDEALAPVAAEVTVSGRVMTADGQGIKNAIISVQGGNLTTPVFVRTASLGYYTVSNLQAGETYILTINSKRFVFAVPSRVLSVSDSIEGVDFVAEPMQ